jgi:hypothetical protein
VDDLGVVVVVVEDHAYQTSAELTVRVAHHVSSLISLTVLVRDMAAAWAAFAVREDLIFYWRPPRSHRLARLYHGDQARGSLQKIRRPLSRRFFAGIRPLLFSDDHLSMTPKL